MRAWIVFLALTLVTIGSGFTSEAPKSKVGDFIHKNWGLSNNVANSHVDAPAAWALLDSSTTPVVVAVIDTGIDASHPELMLHTSKFGWDFVKKKRAVDDNHGHGTHVAGIIGAVSRWRVLMMPIVYYSDTNPGKVNLANTIAAIRYAVDHGAKIINYSGGGPEFSEEEFLAYKYAEKHGVLVVTAAGNEKHDIDVPKNKYYPAAYPLPNIIVVQAHDINSKRLSSSSWGRYSVDVSAPGENIYSTLPGERYGYMSGTSQATAFVSGIAALVWSQNKNLTYKEVRQRVLNGVDLMPQFHDLSSTGGKVNAYKALNQKGFALEVQPVYDKKK